MAKIRREIKRAAVPNKTATADQIATACAGNPNAAGLATELAALAAANTALANTYKTSQVAAAELQKLYLLEHQAEDAWNAAFDDFADAAQAVTKGDAVKIDSMALVAYETGKPHAVGPLALVGNLVATTGDFVGTVDLAWDKVTGAKSYEVQVSTTPNDEASWKHATTSPRSSATVNGLTSGTKYYFRVAAIGTAGQGPWSDLAVKMAG